jgi:hypothetical protein
MGVSFDPNTGNIGWASGGGGTGSEVIVDTKANIIALTPDEPTVAFATDTKKKYLWDGTNWRVQSLELPVDAEAPDMGYTQDSDRNGYTKEYITNKKLYNVTLQGHHNAENGAIRINTDEDPDRLEVYLRDRWNRIFYDLSVAEGDFRHTPLTNQIYVWKGDSVKVGLNGRSTIQEYRTSMGAFPPPKVISGGEF